MVVTRFGNNRYTGTDIDTKPTNVPAGAEFFTDTGNYWIHNGTAWELVIEPSAYGSGGGAVAIDDLTDVDTSTVAPTNNDVLTWNSTDSEWVPAEPPGASGGEANTVTNVGTGEGTLAKTKVGTDIPLKSLKQGTNVTLANNADDVTITSAYPPDSTDAVKGIVELSLSNGSESAGGRAVQDNDTRLTNARTPTAHNHAGSDINSGTVPAAQLPNASNTVKGAVITSLANGTESAGTKVILDSDTRLTNSRTPTTHAHSGADITSGTVGATRGGTGKATFTQHALIKGGASNAYTEIPIGTTNQVLSVVSGTPAWRSLDNETVGFSQATGGGTVYEITHNMGAAPTYVFLDCMSHSTGRTFTIDATKITVTFDSVVAGGANAVKIMWRAIL